MPAPPRSRWASSTTPAVNVDAAGTASVTAEIISSAGNVMKRSSLAWLRGGALGAVGAVFWI